MLKKILKIWIKKPLRIQRKKHQRKLRKMMETQQERKAKSRRKRNDKNSSFGKGKSTEGNVKFNTGNGKLYFWVNLIIKLEHFSIKMIEKRVYFLIYH